MTFVLSLCFSLLLTAVLIPPFVKLGQKAGMLDLPNPRKVHSSATPRTGGISLVIGAMVPFVWLLRLEPVVLGICLGALCIFVMGVIDDLKDLDYRLKFAGQLVAAVLTLGISGMRFRILEVLWPGSTLDFEVLDLCVSIVFLVATINMINLADGLDGLAAGICLLIFTSVGFLAYLQSDPLTVALCVCMVGASIGFLRFNTYPAMVFLGDTGSQFLGFMVGNGMMLLTQSQSAYSPALGMFLIGIPVIDTSVVVVERFIDGRPLFKPDMNHLHHKLLKIGFKHYHAVVVIYATQLGMILLGWQMRHLSGPLLFGIYLCLMTLFISLVLLSRIRQVRNAGKLDAEVLNGVVGRPALRRSRLLISQLAWFLILGGLLAFYLCSPIWARPVAKGVGLYSLGFAVLLTVSRCFKRSPPGLFLRIAAYFAAVYYILAFDWSDQAVLWNPERSAAYTVVFIVMGISYFCYIITTFEEIPLVTMDYLLLGVVILCFSLPTSYLMQYHLHTIAAKSLITLLNFELLYYKLKDMGDLIIVGLVVSLSMNFVMAFWPWVV